MRLNGNGRRGSRELVQFQRGKEVVQVVVEENEKGNLPPSRFVASAHPKQEAFNHVANVHVQVRLGQLYKSFLTHDGYLSAHG